MPALGINLFPSVARINNGNPMPIPSANKASAPIVVRLIFHTEHAMLVAIMEDNLFFLKNRRKEAKLRGHIGLDLLGGDCVDKLFIQQTLSANTLAFDPNSTQPQKVATFIIK